MPTTEQVEKLKKVVSKSELLGKGGDLALANEFVGIEEKIDKVDEKLDKKIEGIKSDISTGMQSISEELKKKLESELVLEINKEELKGDKGDAGDNYVLTEKDKEDIAKTIKVPVVEKVIEKTEVIREQPIVTEKTVKIENPVLGTEIVEKINELPIDDDSTKIDAKHIKNLPVATRYGGGKSNLASLNGTNQLELQFPFKIGYDSYMEYTESGGNITQVNYWSNATKSTKLFTKDITYSGSDPTLVVTTDNLTNKTLTQTIAYDGSGTITSVTKVIA